MPIVDLSLEGKVALITGGSKGIGRAIALAYAEHGADVAIAARGAEALESTRKEIEVRGRRALPVPTDVCKDEDLEGLVQQTCADLGGIDILVNNAGGGDEERALGTLSRKSFDLGTTLNLWAPLRLSQLCHETMKARGGGVVINISSNEAIRPAVGMGIYGAAKAGLVSVSEILAKEWAADGIRVNAICPGLVRTELASSIVDHLEKNDLKINPAGMIGEPEDLAGWALLLASPAGRFATATTFIVDGGEMRTGAFGDRKDISYIHTLELNFL